MHVTCMSDYVCRDLFLTLLMDTEVNTTDKILCHDQTNVYVLIGLLFSNALHSLLDKGGNVHFGLQF